jgi:hypothetical protein
MPVSIRFLFLNGVPGWHDFDYDIVVVPTTKSGGWIFLTPADA